MAANIDMHMALTPHNVAYQAAALNSANIFASDVNLFQVTGATTILSARQQGYAMGTADYVTFMDDDDLVLNLDPLAAFVATNKPDAIFTNSNVMDSDGNILNQWCPPSFTFDKDLLFGGVGARPHQLLVMKRTLVTSAMKGVEECAKYLGVTDVVGWPCDYALILEIALISNWQYFNQVCYDWRMHSAQSSTGVPQYFGAILKYYQNKRKHAKSSWQKKPRPPGPVKPTA
jgi:glycosyltransferase involved in cell wall biosynthesis